MPNDDASRASQREVRITLAGLVGIAVVVVLLVFALPRTPPPPPSLADPGEAFVDRTGIVSPQFAHEWAGALLNDDRAQIVVYVDRRPPEGEFAAWAIQTASDWKVGAAKDDTGVVLFVFTEPRLARIEVGYGLEDRLTDARVRRLLEDHLVPAFALGRYEQGFDDLIGAMRKALGGEDADSIHARAAAARKRDDVPWIAQVGPAFARTPRVIAATAGAFMQGDAGTRIAIVVASGVVLAIAAFGVTMFGNTVWRLVRLPSTLRARRVEGSSSALSTSGYEIVMGCVGVGIAVTLLMFVLLAGDSFFTRKGSFAGAGAMVTWQAPR